MKTIAFHIASDIYKNYSDKMIRSFKHFHPDIPFKVFSQSDINEAKEKYGQTPLYGIFGAKLANQCDLLIQIDADSIVCDRIDEVLKGDYEVAGVLNGSNEGFQTTGVGIGQVQYLNAGLVASTLKAFWTEWKEKTLKDWKKYRYGEQDIFNHIFYSGKYKTKVLDPIEGDVYYGSSSCGQWDKTYVVSKGEKIMLNGKTVKVIHFAGQASQKKFNFVEFPPVVQGRIKNLIGDTSPILSQVTLTPSRYPRGAGH